MEKEFVPYEIALKLRELGFDEECFRTYSSTNETSTIIFNGVNVPLWQQAFDWFREKHNFYSFIKPLKFTNKIEFYIYEDDRTFSNSTYLTYEEARLECLKKLIELCKNN